MLVKQNSIFCAIYLMLAPLHTVQIGSLKLTPGVNVIKLFFFATDKEAN